MSNMAKPEDLEDSALADLASESLMSALYLGLFDALAGGTVTVEDASEALGTEPARLARLLATLEAMGLVTVTDGRFGNAPLVERYLVRGGQQDFRAVLSRRLDLRLDDIATQLTPAQDA